MTKSEKRKLRLQNFKTKTKMDNKKQQEAIATAQTKQYMVPRTNWESNEFLEFRGDLVEAIEATLMTAYESIQKCAQALQLVVQHNIKAGKIKMDYVWNNGEEPTEDEVRVLTTKLKEQEAARQKQLEQAEELIKQKQSESKSGLVDATGQPLVVDQPSVGIAK